MKMKRFLLHKYDLERHETLYLPLMAASYEEAKEYAKSHGYFATVFEEPERVMPEFYKGLQKEMKF